MRFPWTKKEPEEELFLEPRKRQKETLSQVSEKLLIKRMKRDEEYGLKVAERVKNISGKSEDKSLMSQLQELKELRKALSEFGGESGQDTGIGAFLKGFLSEDMGKAVAMQLGQKMFSGQPQYQVRTEQPEPEQIEKARQPSLPEAKPKREPKAKEPKQEPEKQQQADVTYLIDMLDWTPEDIVAELKDKVSKGEPEAIWLGFLANISYDSLIAQLKPLQDSEYGDYITQIVSEDKREWVETLLSEAKNAYNELKNAGK